MKDSSGSDASPRATISVLLDALAFACRSGTCHGQMRLQHRRNLSQGGASYTCSLCGTRATLDRRGMLALSEERQPRALYRPRVRYAHSIV